MAKRRSKSVMKMPKIGINKLLKDINKMLKKNDALLYLSMIVIIAILGKTIVESLNLNLWKKPEKIEGNSNGKTMVLCHWKDCGHCKRMMPEWEKLEANHGTSLTVKKVEKDEDPALMKKHGVKGFPTILLLDRSGNKIKQYEGERTFDAMKSFAEENQ